MKTICRYLDVSVLNDKAQFTSCFDAIPWNARKEKINSFRFEKDRRLSLGAGIVLETVLWDFEVTDLRIRIEENGKPVLESGEIFFSVSHSGTMAVCAASRAPIGADAEEIRPVQRDSVMRFLHEEEQEMIRNAEDPDLAFFRIWTRRESLGKRSGEGIARSLRKESLVSFHPADAIFFHEFFVNHHLITVCTEERDSVRFLKTEL